PSLPSKDAAIGSKTARSTRAPAAMRGCRHSPEGEGGEAARWRREVVVAENVGTRLAAPDAALRLTAHDSNEIGAFAGLSAQFLVGDDQRGARRHQLVDALQRWAGNGDTVQNRLGHSSVGSGGLAGAKRDGCRPMHLLGIHG